MTTPNIGMTTLSNSQGQYLNANETFAIIDALLGKVVKDKDLSAPPGSPSNGDVYIVGASPTGLWSGQATKVAFWSSDANAWVFITPKEGWKLEPTDEDVVYRFDGSAWQVWSSGGGGSSGLTITSKSADYTLVLGDANNGFLHPSADTAGRTWTIPANASVAFPIGTAISFFNQNGAGAITIAITSDTMRLAGAGTTGSRTLAANGIATAIKITSTEWLISGVGLT